MKLLFTMRTADRSPKRNYLRATLRSLLLQGVSPQEIRVFATDPNTAWLSKEGIGLSINVSAPRARLTANANGIAQVSALDGTDADWIVMSEDDLDWCSDPLGSMSRWLEAHATPDVMVYRFFAFDVLTKISEHVASAPLREMKGSQVVAMRAADARRFAAWAKAHPLDWRPKNAPYQDKPHSGFDKLIGYWALQDRPSVTHGLVSRPFFVRHIGTESSLHSRGRRMDAHFIGSGKAYGQTEHAWH
jgi:hypothetical protein